MIIESIQIENFQCFYGRLPELKLGKGCTVIHGRNSAGKSRLFNAFCWCFMNRYYETTGGWRDGNTNNALQSLISDSALARHKEFDVSVEIKFELDDEEIGLENLTLRRSFHVSPSGPSSSVCTLSYFCGKDYQEYTDPDVVNRKLDAWFDPAIRRYMWFQGETLDELIQFEKKDSLQSLTKKISHYRHYEDLVGDAHAFLKYTKRKLENAQTEASRDQKKANGIDEDLRKKRVEIAKLREAIVSHRKNIKHCEEARLDAEAIIELTASSAELLSQAKRSEEEHKRHGEALESHRKAFAMLKRTGQLLALHVEKPESFFPKREDLQKRLVLRKKDLGAIDQSISLEVPNQSDLEKLIKSEKCDVCGTKAPLGSTAHTHMVSRLEEMRAQSGVSNELKRVNLFQKEIPEVIELLQRRIDDAQRQNQRFKDTEKELEQNWVLARDKRRMDEEKVVGIPSEAGSFEKNKLRKQKAIQDQKRHRHSLERDQEREVTLKNRIAISERELSDLSSDDQLESDPEIKKSSSRVYLRLVTIRSGPRERELTG